MRIQSVFRTARHFHRTSIILALVVSVGLAWGVPRSVHAGAPTITEYPVPTTSGQLYGMTTGPDGNLWFTEAEANKIGRSTLAGSVTEFSVPTPNGLPTGITVGPDGNLWFSEEGTDKIGQITTSGTITEFPLPSLTTGTHAPTGITTGPDNNLWFAEANNIAIGKMTTAGVVTEYPLLSYPGSTYDVITGPDGNLWATNYFGIYRITTSGTVTYFEVGGPSAIMNPNVRGLTVGPDGNVWFVCNGYGEIDKITTSGTLTRYQIPVHETYPYEVTEPNDITAGADGNLWFTDAHTNTIDRITTSGVITSFPIPTASSTPYGITKGPNNHLWFTERTAHQIGQLDPTNLYVGPVQTIGVYAGGTFYLRNSNTTGFADITVPFDPYGVPAANYLPVVGDWNNDGIDTIGVYDRTTGVFLLRDSNTPGPVDHALVMGNPGDEPLAGHWDSTMTGDGVGVYRPSNGLLYVKRTLLSGYADYTMVLGNPGDHGIAGDWDGNGYDSVGVFRPANTMFYLANWIDGTTSLPAIIFSDYNYSTGPATLLPVAGDWTGSGSTHIGYLYNGVFSLKYTHSGGAADNNIVFGPTGALPVSGHWAATSQPPSTILVAPSAAPASLSAPHSAPTTTPNSGGLFD